MASWIQNCQICNDGLCIRIEELKREGHSERASAEIMQEEAYDAYPELKKEFAAERIRRRYKYHMKEKVGQIVPKKASWPMCKKCGQGPVERELSRFGKSTDPAEHGLCKHCHWEEQIEKKPNCRECAGHIRGEVYNHGLCEICRKKELREAARENADKRLDARQKEFDATPVDAETEEFWTDSLNNFKAIVEAIEVPDGVLPCGKVGDEMLEKIKDFREQLYTLVHGLDEVIEQSEVSVRVQ